MALCVCSFDQCRQQLVVKRVNLNSKMGSGGSKNMVGDSGVQVMPLYYVKDAFATADDIWRARASWKLITEDASPEYLKLKNDPENPLAAESCMAWFFTSFYDHLFEIHPSSRQQFKNDIGVQGRAFANMIDTSLRLIDDPEHLVKTLNEVAKVLITILNDFSIAILFCVFFYID